MACLNLLNNDQQHYNSTPRISFSNDFADPKQQIKLENSYREAPVSSDFAFSVPNYSMISADEVFFKGKIVPTKMNTLRDELLCGDDDDFEDGTTRIAKGTSRWREKLGLGLGLKRSYGVGKKCEKKNDGLERIDEMKIQDVVGEDFKGFL